MEPLIKPLSEQVTQAEALAKRWMPGFRQTIPGQAARRSWEHPQDLVKLLAERPGEFSEAGQMKAVCIAWMHDLLEDGIKEDGKRVTKNDLIDEFDLSVVRGVQELTHVDGTPKYRYLENLGKIEYIYKLVKCVDRICNLREGRQVFKPARWARYVGETQQYILPLTDPLRDGTNEWLKKLLLEAMALPHMTLCKPV
jgi:(p)ppGpp synthase/HD superfamily hydrolase